MEILRIIITAMIFVITSYVVGLLGFHWRTLKCDNNQNILRQPKSIIWISLLLTIGFIVGMLLVVFLTNSVEAFYGLFFIPFIIVGLYLLLYSLNWRIEVKEETFIFRNMFRVKKEYSYDRITSIKRIKIGGYKILINKKVITVDYWTLGLDLFWDKIKLIPQKRKEV